jgi:adenylyltransferase/sulfurtransferase
MTQPALDEKGLPVGYGFDPDKEVTPRQLKARLDAGEKPGEDFLLIDCRRPDEWEITHIDGATLVPLQELPELFDDHLAGHEDKDVVVYCRSGRRSMDFVTSLRRSGFEKARSMAGGVLLWNRDIQPGGPQY